MTDETNQPESGQNLGLQVINQSDIDSLDVEFDQTLLKTVDRLSPKVIQCLDLYLMGYSMKVAAKESKVTVAHMWQVKKSQVGRDYILAFYRQTSEWHKGLLVKAIKVVSDNLNDADPDIQLKAAGMLMKHLGKLDEDGNRTPTMSGHEVAKALYDKLDKIEKEVKKPHGDIIEINPKAV